LLFAIPPVAGALAVPARVLKQLTVSDRQLILLKLCMSVCAHVCLVMEMKVNIIRCDIRGGARE